MLPFVFRNILILNYRVSVYFKFFVFFLLFHSSSFFCSVKRMKMNDSVFVRSIKVSSKTERKLTKTEIQIRKTK